MNPASTPARPVRKIPFVVQWLTWPVVFVASITLVLIAPRFGWDPVGLAGACIGLSIPLLIVMEFIWPADLQWRMTWRSFFRDIQFFAVNGSTIFATTLLFSWIGVELDKSHQGLITEWPLFAAVPVSIFVVDFFQYWQHRIAHDAPGPFGKFLWRAHAPHHLPDQVYVFMHPAGHPINAFVVRGLVTILPLYLLGANGETIVLTNLVIGIQGLFSHTNLDLRAGWFNYIFVGTELHRYHHNADRKESGNYAVALSVIDILFGSFVYRPGKLPERFGVNDPEAYPQSYQVLRTMLLPFGLWRKPRPPVT